MTDSKTPEWVEAAAGDLALDYVDWLGRDKVDPDAEHVLSASFFQALLSAYERGRKEGIEDAAKVVQAHPATVALPDEDVVRFGMFARQANRSDLSQAIRQLLEVKG